MDLEQHNIYQYQLKKIQEQVQELIPYPKNYYKIIMLYNQLHMIATDPKILSMAYYGIIIEGGLKKQTVDTMPFDASNPYQKNVMNQLHDETQDQCVICMEPYTRPTITPCFHIFCHDCITTSI